jgi:metal-responsive CopG/Arc/MetJ family transcriptional regulator
MKRPPHRAPVKGKFRVIIIYLPQELIPLLDAAVVKSESTRDKFIRQAVREKLVMENS